MVHHTRQQALLSSLLFRAIWILLLPLSIHGQSGFQYNANHGEDSRLIAYVGNWFPCPTAQQMDAYSHIVVAFASSVTWAESRLICDSQCNIRSTVAVCNNDMNQGLVDQWRAAGKKVILSFGGASMGVSWDGDENNCWDYCFGKEEQISTSLVNIVRDQRFDGIDIDYEYCYDIEGSQKGQCGQRNNALYSDEKAQKFINDMTAKVRTKLDALQASNGYSRGRYIVSHAPMDSDLKTPSSKYFQILKARNAELDFLMPQFYNGVTRPAIDGVGGTGNGVMSAAGIFSSLANDLFPSQPNKVVFGYCLSADCVGNGSNANGMQAAKITADLKTYNNGAFLCNGGAYFWESQNDVGGAWSDVVLQEVRKTAGCSGSGPTRWKTLNYLYSIRGQGTVAGVHERTSSAPSQHTEKVFQISGKYPGLWSGDFLFDFNRRSRQAMIDEAKLRWNAGTMINIMYHSCNPATTNLGDECEWGDHVKGPQSSMLNETWVELITDGTALNQKWKTWLDEIAVYLQDLKNNGVEVLFRPFHEMNQGVFWWGGRKGPKGTLRLYQISHDYLTNVKRLDNLIWVWDIQDFDSLKDDVQNYNPGSNYYEVVALDVYAGYETWKYEAIRDIAKGKPIAIGECDRLPDASRLKNEPLWTFFMSWSELTFEVNTPDQIKSVYNSQQAITRDEMGNWKNGALSIKPPTSKPTTKPPTNPQRTTTWACYNPDRQSYVSSVQIWWGHTAVDGSWACNNWRAGACKNRCSAKEVTKSHWNCYRQNDLKFVGQVNIDWGHEVKDGVWACNSWVSDCGNSPGGCLVTGAAHWDSSVTWSCDAYKVSDGCSGGTSYEKDALGFACNQHDYCYFGPIKNDFGDTYRHCSNLFYNEVVTKHWGFWDYYRLTAEAWKNSMNADAVAKGGPVGGPGFGDSFQNQQLKSDWECYLGKSKPQGYNLAPCQAGGGCAATSTCYNCCDGNSGSQCNKPWWE